MTGCATGPTTSTEVCEKYDKLATEWSENDVFGNPVFTAAGQLGGVAKRYEEDPNIVANGEALKAISDSDSVNGFQLDDATWAISQLCGESSLTGYSAKLAVGIAE